MVQKFHCKIVFQFNFHTGGPYLILLGTESAIFQEKGWLLSRNFVQSKLSVYFVILFSGWYSHAIKQLISTFSMQGLLLYN